MVNMCFGKEPGLRGFFKYHQFWLTVLVVGSASLAISLGLGIQYGIVGLPASEPRTVYEPISSVGNGRFNTRYERPRPPVDGGLVFDDFFLTGAVALVIGVGLASLTLAIRGNESKPNAAMAKSDAEQGVTSAQGIDVSFWAGKSAGSGDVDVTDRSENRPWLYDPAFRTACLVTLSTGSLLTIVFGLFAQGWETAHLTSRVPYIAFEKQIVEADFTFAMGVYGYNITMSCKDCFEPEHETCDDSIPYSSCGFYYNYGFQFSGPRGGWPGYEYFFQRRNGFGKYSNTLNRQFRDAIADGMPLPIIEIHSALIIDGEKIRWQRRYIKAAYGTFVCMYWALTMWIMANIIGFMWVQSSLAAEKVGVSVQLDDVVYKRSESIWSAFSWSIIGISSGLLLACIVWDSVRPDNFPGAFFEDGVLAPEKGWCFDMCLGVGILHLIAGITLLHYSTIQTQLQKMKGGDDEELSDFNQSALDISEAEMKTM